MSYYACSLPVGLPAGQAAVKAAAFYFMRFLLPLCYDLYYCLT